MIFAEFQLTCQYPAESSFEHGHKNKIEEPDIATAFIVDDDLSVLKALSRLLESDGYIVETFTSAEAFLQREHYTGYGCLVVDLHMPVNQALICRPNSTPANTPCP